MVPNLLKPSQLGEIPKDWKRVKLSDVMKVRQGLQIAISERLTSPTSTSKEYITIQSIKKTDQVREYVEAPSQRVICSKDDVLMTRTGNTGIVVTGVEGAFHNNFFLMDFDKNRINTTFLVNYLRSPRIQHLILTKAGASTIPDLNHKDFYSIEFPLAPILEQQKIAKILSTWDKAISTTERLIDNSTQQKKALMQQLLTGKKRLLDDEGERFEGEWDWVDLEDVCDVKGGKRLPKGNALSEAKTSNPYIRVADMYMGGVDLSDIKYVPESIAPLIKNYTISKDDLFITVAGTLGIVGKIPNELDGANLTENADKLTNIKCDKTFLLYVMMSSIIQRYIEAESTQNAQPKLALARIRGFKVPLPNLEEQQKIAIVLTNADKEIELLEQQLADLQQEKKALMQVLLTGKVRVVVE